MKGIATVRRPERRQDWPPASGSSRDEVLRPPALAKVWTGVGAPFETMAVPGVVLGAGDVIVAVELATICGSDVHTVAGHRPAPTPLVLGHEYVGRIVAIGADNAAVGPLVLDSTSAEGPDKDIHMLTLWRHGVYLIEFLWLEQLAALDRSDFLFMVAPLAIDGGTASPVTPLAVL